MTPSEKLYREIPLSQGKCAIVDAEDYDWLMQWKWSASRVKNNFYAVRTEWIPGGRQRRIYLHRVILSFSRVDKRFVDHVNLDTLDNRRKNLRVATRAQNSFNTRLSIHNKTGFKGVSFDKKRNRYIAHIYDNKKHKYLGSSRDPKIAAEIYRAAANRIAGEFVRLD